MLQIYAGDTALKTIEQQGFAPSLFNTFLGASGGPKWFTLFGLDRYLFGQFFCHRSEPLNIIGSSAGAYRAACFGQNEPVVAIERLAKHYSETVYANNAKPAQITAKAAELLDILFGEHGIEQVLHNPVCKVHFIVAKSKGLVGCENPLLQGLGLVKSLISNRVGRSLLKGQYERFIFQPADSQLRIVCPDKIPTHTVALSENNMKNALLASGAIPMVMQGVANIEDSPKGMYRDGGVIDYHFDFEITNPGLTLYPHFSSTLRAGWFDKNSARKVRHKSHDRTVLLCPTAEFIAALPYQKIPDRTDFTTMEPQQRLAYWQQVFADSEQLAEQFDQFYQTQDIGKIKPIRQLMR